MSVQTRFTKIVRSPLFILPGLHFFLVILSMILSINTPGGTYFRMLGADPVVAAAMMVYDGMGVIVVGLLLFGTGWWFFIGWIGWASVKRRIGRLVSVLCVLFAAFFGVVGIGLSIETLRSDDFRSLIPMAGAILQYVCVALLCAGVFVSAGFALVAVMRENKSTV